MRSRGVRSRDASRPLYSRYSRARLNQTCLTPRLLVLAPMDVSVCVEKLKLKESLELKEDVKTTPEGAETLTL